MPRTVTKRRARVGSRNPDNPTGMRLRPDDNEVARQLRDKWRMPGLPLVEVIRMAFRRQAESEGVKLAS